MESEASLVPDMTDGSPKRDSNTAKESESRAINEATQIDVNGSSVDAFAAIETDTAKMSENDKINLNQVAQNDELQNGKKASETLTNDSKPTEEERDNNTNIEHTSEEHKENENSGDKSPVQVTAEEKKKLEVLDKRIAKQFRVILSNKKVNKIFFGTVDKPIPGKVEAWRILYDDGDVDIMTRNDVMDAICYYKINEKYDTNRMRKVPFSLLLHEKDAEDDKNKSNRSTTKSSGGKSSPPKRGKQTKIKVVREKAIPEWTGPPDEPLDGGWPQGWVKKVFARKSGVSKGSKDRYWYSPKEQIKFRSMVQVKKFLNALNESGGDEKMAKKTMHKY